MPKKPIDYSNTIIYKIVCNNLNIKDCYVGHTTDLRKRKNQHKSDCNKNKDLRVYNFINENGGWNNFDMIMIEKYNCKDDIEARARERYWLETLGATLNGSIPNRTMKEYLEQNHTQIREKANQKCTCDCRGKYLICNKAQHIKTQKHQNWLKKQTENDV